MLKNKKIFICLLMSVVITVCTLFSPVLSVSADTLKTISEGEIWHTCFKGGSETDCVIFKPTQSGFYALTVFDYAGTSNVYIEITDLTTEQPYNYIYQQADTQGFTSEKMYMSGGHEYELICYYSGDDYYSDLTADLSVKFDAVNYTPNKLPYGQVTSSNMQVNFEPQVKEWFSFTTDQSGDYSLNYSTAIDAYVEVYNAQSGELVDARYIPYLAEISGYSIWLCSEQLVFSLDGNTEYYFCIEEYQQSSSKLSISKNEKDIENVTVNSLSSDIDWRDVEVSSISAAAFDFNILFTDGTAQIMDCYEALNVGINLPYVEYIGESVNVNGLYLPLSTRQPILVYYNGNYTVEYITVPSISDTLIDLGYGDLNEFDSLEICYEDNDEYTEYKRIKVEKTGVYKLCNSESFDEVLSSFGIVMLDEQNNIIRSVDTNGYYWPLVAGREYVLCFKYCYNEELGRDLNPYICKEIGNVFSDTWESGWYYDAVTYALGRNIMSGYGGTDLFGTADNIQRQDFLVMLARLDGVDLSQYENTNNVFPDVSSGSYYEAAVMWGYENGIVSGYQDGKFGVGDKITREQLVKFLYNYADYKGLDTSYSTSTKQTVKNKYADYKNVSDWAQDAVLWAIEMGVIKGKTDTTIVPYGNALRCEVAQIVYNIFVNEIF